MSRSSIHAGRIARILLPEGTQDSNKGVILVETFIVSNHNDKRVNMPTLTRPRNGTSLTETVSLIKPKVGF